MLPEGTPCSKQAPYFWSLIVTNTRFKSTTHLGCKQTLNFLAKLAWLNDWVFALYKLKGSINKKNFVLLRRFWPSGRAGAGVWSELIFVTKIFFSDIVEWSSKNWWKIIPADVKANKNQKKWKIWWLYLANFYKKYLQDLKCSVKKVCTFHLILAGIQSILISSVKSRGVA